MTSSQQGSLEAALWALVIAEMLGRLTLTRWLFRTVTTTVMKLDLLMVSLVKRVYRPRYELVGSCQKRGACCTQIVADPPSFIKSRDRLIRLYLGMHRLLHNFHLVARGPTGQFIMRCGYVKTDGRCGIYKFRPRLCRTYPLLPFFAPPSLLPGCGYRVKLRGMKSHARLPIVMAHVGTHHPTPIRRSDKELEHFEDFHLIEAAGGSAGPHPRRP